MEKKGKKRKNKEKRGWAEKRGSGLVWSGLVCVFQTRLDQAMLGQTRPTQTHPPPLPFDTILSFSSSFILEYPGKKNGKGKRKRG